MNREEFRERLSDLGMDVHGFAQVSGWSPATVREWGAGSPVPRPARVIVDLLGRVRGRDTREEERT